MASMTTWVVSPTPTGWTIELGGLAIARVSVDHAVTIHVGDGPEQGIVRIEGAFSISEPDAILQLNSQAPAELGPALALFAKVVGFASISRAGVLTVAFVDGIELTVRPDERFEAWEVHGPKGLRVVSMPGGEVAFWQPTESPRFVDR